MPDARDVELATRAAEARALYAQGLSGPRIAEQLGLHHAPVYNYLADNRCACGNQVARKGSRCFGCRAAALRGWGWTVEDRGHDTACWIWKGRPAKNGYGTVRLGGSLTYAHRAVYEREVGPIPEGLTLDHLCEVPICVNPSHLEPVTRAENSRRIWRRRAARRGGYARRVIPYGHEHELRPVAKHDRPDGGLVVDSKCIVQFVVRETGQIGHCGLEERRSFGPDGRPLEVRYRFGGLWLSALDLLRLREHVPVAECDECHGEPTVDMCDRCGGLGVTDLEGKPLEPPGLRVVS